MGILRNGYYTRGYKTFDDIEQIPKSFCRSGDTVFDTTFNCRKVFDGNNWVSGNQKSLITNGASAGVEQICGAISTISASVDGRIASGIGAGNLSNIVGVVQTRVGFTIPIGSYAILQYSNICYVAINNITANRGNYAVLNSGTPPTANFGRAIDATSPANGAFGIFLEDKTGFVTALTFIRMVETWS